MEDFWSMLEIILVLAVVFWLAWFFTRFIARRSGGRAAGRFMRVVDRLAIGNDKAMFIVKTGKRYAVIGVAGHEMRLIRMLDDDEAELFDAAEAESRAAGAESTLWNGVQSFGERLGFAMKRRARPQPRQYPYADEYDRDDARAKPQEKTPDEQSVIDMMNERIKLRKDSKWK